MSEYGIVALHTFIIYIYLIVLVRIFGRRQLEQLTVIDLLVVILLGSTVETAMINGNTAIRAGLLSAATLMVANFVISKIFGRFKKLRLLAGSGPILLVHDGVFWKRTSSAQGSPSRTSCKLSAAASARMSLP